MNPTNVKVGRSNEIYSLYKKKYDSNKNGSRSDLAGLRNVKAVTKWVLVILNRKKNVSCCGSVIQ